MNKIGQMGVGALIVTFVVALTGLVLFLVVAQTAGPPTDLATVTNESHATGIEGSVLTLTNYKNLADVVIYNATELIPASNYTVANNQVSPTTGALTVTITTGAVSEYANDTWLISGTAQRLDYIDSSGARSLTDMIAVFFALAIAVVVMGPVIKAMKEFT